MSKEEHSASLEIVEDNQDVIEISQNSFHIEVQETNQFLHPEQNDDTFELSLDENSLSFQIEELKEHSNLNKAVNEKKIIPEIKVERNNFRDSEKEDIKPLPIVQEERKRKRKEIFEKYKQRTTENLLASPELQPVSNDLMNTFDEIFRIKSPEKNYEKEANLKRQISLPQINDVTGFKKKESAIGMSELSFDYMPITFESQTQKNEQICQVEGVKNKDSISSFEIPSDMNEPKIIDLESNLMMGTTNSFIIDSDVNKISMIFPEAEEVSRDSADLETFLKSELFKDEILDNTIRRTDTSYKNFEVSMVNPSIMMHEQDEAINHKNFNLDERFGVFKNDNVAEINAKNAEKECEAFEKSHENNVEIFEAISIPTEKILKQAAMSFSENRIPVYLREIRRKNTIYPNFLQKSKSENFYQEECNAFKELLAEFRKGLTFLLEINELAYERFSVLTSLEKALLNSLTLENFLTSGWEITSTLKELHLLKPQENFLKRKYEYEKVKGALNNYIYIVSYYEKCDFNLADEKTQKKYLEIRSKFWQIEKNIKMIGEDIYLLSIVQIFPQHYYEFIDLLKHPFSKINSKNELKYFTKMLAKFYNLRQSGDVLSLSEVGRCVKAKLEKMIQKFFIV